MFIFDLDHLQRIWPQTELSFTGSQTLPQAKSIWLSQITSFARVAVENQPNNLPEKLILPSENALTGLYGSAQNRTPIISLIHSSGSKTQIAMGTWVQDGRQFEESFASLQPQILRSNLEGSYPRVSLKSLQRLSFAEFDSAALVTGLPYARQLDPNDTLYPIDRLIQAMSGNSWAAMVVAHPLDASDISRMRQKVIGELRRVHNAGENKEAAAPLVKHYQEILSEYLNLTTLGLTIGAWRTAVYLLADKANISKLVALWKGIFSDSESLLEPINAVISPDIINLATKFAMPDDAAPRPANSEQFAHMFKYQSVLTSKHLAAYISKLKNLIVIFCKCLNQNCLFCTLNHTWSVLV